MADRDAPTAADDKYDLVVVGAGPAGLMAAEVAGASGLRVLVADQMPSVGRKFLMAGKSGLNLTKKEPESAFQAAFHPGEPIARMVAEFGASAVMDWATGLGQAVFTGTTGRVFPEVMKASPLLRAWLTRLDGMGVEVRTRWRWTGWANNGLEFETEDGRVNLPSKAVVLALGGASWRRLGSDGAWAGILEDAGVSLAPFRPANMGLRLDWSDHMAPHLGQPVKGTKLSAGGHTSRGEWVISARGIEGGGVYEVSRFVRDGDPLFVDLAPDLSEVDLAERLAKPRGKRSFSNHLRRVLPLSSVQRALLMEWGRPLPEGRALGQLIKALPVPVQGARDMDEAISTAGGVAWEAVTSDLMLRQMPGVFVAGEMLDWEAPTGGYLITGCLATGRQAGLGAVKWVTDAE